MPARSWLIPLLGAALATRIEALGFTGALALVNLAMVSAAAAFLLSR